jgi:hypothetical protein
MGTSLIGDISVIEVCGNVCGLYFMLEELNLPSHLTFYQAEFQSIYPLAILTL